MSLCPAVAAEFFTFLPQVVEQCSEDILHNLSLVSKSYYKRMRENPLVTHLYQWRPHVTLLRLALSDRKLAAYYNSVTDARRLLRWDEGLDPARLTDYYDAAHFDDFTLIMRDMLASDSWRKIDASKLEAADVGVGWSMLDELATSRLRQLCDDAGVELCCRESESQSYSKSCLDWNSCNISEGEFDIAYEQEDVVLHIPPYEPMCVQLSLGSSHIPRYNSLQEYREMLLGWWLPRACSYKSGVGPIELTYDSVLVLDRVGLLGQFISPVVALHGQVVVVLPQWGLASTPSVKEVIRALSAISQQPDKSIVVHHTLDVPSTVSLLETLLQVYARDDAVSFVLLLHDVCCHVSREILVLMLRLICSHNPSSGGPEHRLTARYVLKELGTRRV